MSITFYLDIIVQRVIINKQGGINDIAIVVVMYQPFFEQTKYKHHTGYTWGDATTGIKAFELIIQ